MVRIFIITTLYLFATTAFSQPSKRPHDKQYQPKEQLFKALLPEKSMKTIEVPEGYHLECVASEPMVQEPASFVFDEDGAIYVCEWLTYMQDEFGKNQLDPVCRVVKLVDTNGDGKMDIRTVFIDKIMLPRTVLPLKDRVLVNLTGSTAVYAYFDEDGDGVADRREVAYEGHQNGGNIEHQSSGLVWNLDNFIYNNYERFKYESGKLTPHPNPTGRISQWGLARDDDGRIYCSWAGGANPVHSFQFPGGYPIVRIGEHASGYRTPHSICRVEDQSSGNYDFKRDRVLTEFSAPCGQTTLRSPLMPEFYGNVITAEPVGRLIRMSTIKNEGGKRVAYNTFPEKEFIRSTDPFFRPVWTETGPDGCLYFSDMYRGIIQEKTWFPHEGNHIWVKRYQRVKEWGMLNVFRHGRIYRLVPNQKKPTAVPKMKNLSSRNLVQYLSNGNGWVRDTAQKLLVYNQDTSVVDDLIALAAHAESIPTQLAALWSLEGLNRLNEKTLFTALNSKEERVRIAGIHLAEGFLWKDNKKVEARLLAMIDEATPDTVMQLLNSLQPIMNPDFEILQERIQSTYTNHPLMNAYIKQRDDRIRKQELTPSAKAGIKTFESFCITCHGKDGKGAKEESGNLLAPSLRNNRWFVKGKREIIFHILLKGQIGPIGDDVYGEGLMLPLEAAYNDKQLADVINYIGLTWNQWKKPVAASVVKKVREKIIDRKAPYTNEELIGFIKP